ncbi:MAG: hypothetical protein PHW40_05100, partial [Candidatus Izemoplasmatales bacterium]|nr:hypothetical protein [Candidatus Izemoplasmatales bacterium]
KLEWAVKPFTVEKVFFEKWQDDEYKGGETSYYINGALEKRNKQAESVIRQFLGVEELNVRFDGTKLRDIALLPFLLNIEYVRTIDYKLLRGLITDIVGDIDPKGVINENPEMFGRLVEPLRSHGLELETLKTSLRTEKFGSKDKRGVLDTIAGIEMAIEEISKEDDNGEDQNEAIENAKRKVNAHEKELVELNVALKRGEEEVTREYDLKIAETQNELNIETEKIRAEYDKRMKTFNTSKQDTEIEGLKKSLHEKREAKYAVDETITKLERDIYQFDRTIREKQDKIKEKTEVRETLLAEWKKAKSPSQQSSDTLTCPHCGQVFNIASTKEHQNILFKRLDDINRQGQSIKAEIETLTNDIMNANHEKSSTVRSFEKSCKERDELNEAIAEITRQLSEKEAERNQTRQNAPVLDYETEQVKSIRSRLNTLKTEKGNIVLDFAISKQKTKSRIAEIESELPDLKEIANGVVIKQSFKKRADELTAKLNDVKNRRNEIDDLLALINELEKCMFEALDKKLVDAFGGNITFQLYKVNIDGSIDTRVCEMLVKDKWNNFVNIKNINKGIYPIRIVEFLNRVKQHYGIPTSFVFVDEIGNLDDDHMKMLSELGEQVIATAGSNDPKIIERKFE